MANEIKITTQIVYENGQLKNTIAPGVRNLPQSTAGMTQQTVTVNTTAEEDLTVGGDITTTGVLGLLSLEATTTGNFVKYGAKSSTGGMIQLARLNPKEFHTLRLNSTSTLRWQADTAAVSVQVTVFEN